MATCAPAASNFSRRWPMVPALSLALLLIAGCGGSDSNDATDDASTGACATLNCGEATCLDRADGAVCVCPTGTTFVADSASCRLDAFLQNPSFDDDSAWDRHRGAFIDEDVGELLLSKGAIADGAYAQQRFSLGPYDHIGPIVLELTMKHEDCGARFCNNESGRPVVLIDGRRQQVDPSPMPEVGMLATWSMCVGEAAYGGDKTLTLMSGEPPVSRDSIAFSRISPWRISDIHPRRAEPGECPVPGVVTNGDFEQPLDDGWTLETENSNTTNRVVSRDDGRVLQLGGTECTKAEATSLVSIPSEPGTALSLEVDIPGSTRLHISSSNADLQHVVSEQPSSPTTVCVPRAILGTVQRLTLRPVARFFDLGGDCSQSIDDVSVDSIQFTTDQRCNTEQLFSGGDFEPTPFRGDWHTQATEPNAVNFATETTPIGTNEYLRLENLARCGHPQARKFVHVPMPEQANTNALTFFYRTTAGVGDSAASFESDASGFITLPSTTLWTRKAICFPTVPHGHLIDFFFRLRDPSGGSCGAPVPGDQQLHIDDLAFDSLASCVD